MAVPKEYVLKYDTMDAVVVCGPILVDTSGGWLQSTRELRLADTVSKL